MSELNIDKIIRRALDEDVCRDDVTTRAMVRRDQVSKAAVYIQERGVVCGLNELRKVFQKLDPNARFRFFVEDGDKVKKGKKIAEIKARTRALLSGERVALNFLGHMSGIATQTRKYVEAVKPAKVKIYDTRKTTPGLRELEKHAVKYGGGHNHRFNLNEMALIKDNHRTIFSRNGDFAQRVRQLKQETNVKIEIEADNLTQFREILKIKPDVILLDNMKPAQIRAAVRETKKVKGRRPLLEASGGITLRNIKSYARTGVDRISVGALTHSSTSLDVSLEIIEP